MKTASQSVEVVARVWGCMPSGIAVTPSGRRFLCFPRWLELPAFTVGELLEDGSLRAYPDGAVNRVDLSDPAHHFLSVHSVLAEDDDTLWVLDDGRPLLMPALPGAAKLVEVDIATGTLRRIFVVPYGVARVTTFLNDVRIDRCRGEAGTAFITDSATLGPSAFIVIDLATGRKLRRLDGHPSLQPDREVTPLIEGDPLRLRLGFGITLPYRLGLNGIALSCDRKTIYYCPLNGRRLYSVGADALSDRTSSYGAIASTIRDLGSKCVSDGLECDEQDRVYATDLEQHAVRRRDRGGRWTEFANDPCMRWTDSMAISGNHLYFTVNQIDAMRPFRNWRDERKEPYYLLRAPIQP